MKREDELRILIDYCYSQINVLVKFQNSIAIEEELKMIKKYGEELSSINWAK